MAHNNQQQNDLPHLTAQQIHMSRVKWPKTLTLLFDVVENCLNSEKISRPHLSEKIIVAIAFYFGGRDMYIPNGKSLEMFLRNLRIFQEFNGQNKAELAKEYNMTERRIDQITKEITDLYRHQRNKDAELKGK